VWLAVVRVFTRFSSNKLSSSFLINEFSSSPANIPKKNNACISGLDGKLFSCNRRLQLRLLHRPVSLPPVSLAGVGRGGEPDLWVEFFK
jgi:hypothetical protein